MIGEAKKLATRINRTIKTMPEVLVAQAEGSSVSLFMDKHCLRLHFTGKKRGTWTLEPADND